MPCQIERERANATLDWAKRTVFPARLQPGMNRFDTQLKELKQKPPARLKARKGAIQFKSATLQATINTCTGLVDRLRIKGRDVLARQAFVPLVVEDHSDPWSLMQSRQAGRVVGKFKLLSTKAGTECSGVPKTLPSVRVIEDGPVRSVIHVTHRFLGAFTVETAISTAVAPAETAKSSLLDRGSRSRRDAFPLNQ